MSGAVVDIRRMLASDVDAYRDLRQRSLIDHPDAFASTAEEWGTDPQTYLRLMRENAVFVATVDGVLAGFTVLGLVGRVKTKTRHKVEVWSVYVAPEFRGRSLARLLMKNTIAEARRLGFEAIVLTVTSHNHKPRKLYESLGFEAYGVEKRFLKLPDGRYCDDVMMELDLVSANDATGPTTS
ncbi:MAG: GNAT family N-acetyltransferase [Beijerinckiaceae bacterium]